MPLYKVRTSIPATIYYEYKVTATSWEEAQKIALSGEVWGEMTEFLPLDSALETVEETELATPPENKDTNFITFLKSQL